MENLRILEFELSGLGKATRTIKLAEKLGMVCPHVDAFRKNQPWDF